MWLLIFHFEAISFQNKEKGGLQTSEMGRLLRQVRNVLKNLSLPKIKDFILH